MGHIYVRPLRLNDEEDRNAFVAAAESCVNGFPKELFALPSTVVMVAEKSDEYGKRVVMYQPFYASLVLGSLVPVGGSSDSEMASAMHQMTAAAYTKAHEIGAAEVVMFSDTPATANFAQRHEYKQKHPAFSLEVR